MKLYKNLSKDFTVVSNKIHRSNLSLKAIGLYTYLVSKPDGWSFSERGIATQVRDGRDSIRTAISELEEAGFLTRKRVRQKDGKLRGSDWYISDTPSKVTKVGFSNAGKTKAGKRRLLVNTKEVNTSSSSDNYYLDTSSRESMRAAIKTSLPPTFIRELVEQAAAKSNTTVTDKLITHILDKFVAYNQGRRLTKPLLQFYFEEFMKIEDVERLEQKEELWA